jgi:hypothetical protein
MVAMGDQDHLIASKLEDQQRRVRRTLDDRAVKRAPHHAAVEVGRRLNEHDQLDPRMATRELSEMGRQVIGGGCRARADVKGTCLELLGGLSSFVYDFDCAQGGAARFGQGSAHVGETHAPSIALQELQSNRLLEVLQLLCHSCLGQEERGGRPGDMLAFGDSYEGPNLLQGESVSSHGEILAGLMQCITNY